MPNFSTFEEFWPFYLTQHSKRTTRAWHFVGTMFTILCLIAAVWIHPAILLLAPVIGYGFAWYSHFYIEGNKPATFGHPLWSLRADFRMFWLILTGRLEQELKACGLSADL